MALHGRWNAAAQLGAHRPAFARGPLSLVVDSSVVIVACTRADGFHVLRDRDLVAPDLMWSEARSALHEALYRRELSRALADAALARLERAPVRRGSYGSLGDDAWKLADALGWAKTYDAEYVTLARHLGCKLVTLDGRLRRSAHRLGLVVTPAELS